MRLPIQYALTHPDRLPSPTRRSHPADWGSLDFAPLTRGSYPAYDVVRDAASAGGNRGTVVNAADEVAVAAFLDGRIGFMQLTATLATSVERWGSDREPELDELVELDAEIRDALRMELP
jgi:1-deoxy-D-xylulose-5-phosphate reductoisomerase